jgi:hypothetical protein
MIEKEIANLAGAMVQSILFPETSTIILCKDEDLKSKTFKQATKLADVECANEIQNKQESKITFKNGSTISFITPNPPQEIYRGKRAEIKHWLYDWEEHMIDQSVVDEVLLPYTNIES